MTEAVDQGSPARRALVVTAHPDDVDFGAGGTVASWVAAGTEVVYCIVTDGDAGGSDPTQDRAARASIRRAEQRAAAVVLGVSDVRFLGRPDGRLEVDLGLRADITRVLRDVRPDRVITHSPVRNLDRMYASHPDHLAAGEAALCAVYPDARNAFAHPELLAEGLEPHVVSEVWLMTGPAPLTGVDVTDLADLKLAALHCHRSQLADPDATDAGVRGWMAATAREVGLPEGRLAEAFRVVTTA